MMAGPGLPDEALSLKLNYDGAQVIYLNGMTPITEGRGQAELKGNRFDLTLVSGRVGTLAARAGQGKIPQRAWPSESTES